MTIATRIGERATSVNHSDEVIFAAFPGLTRVILAGMAPRPLESKEQVVARLRAAAARSGEVMRFGGHHFTHAIVVRAGEWQVRRLVLDQAKGEAYLAKHGTFMPEHAETLSEPGDVVLLAAESREALISALLRAWPLR